MDCFKLWSLVKESQLGDKEALNQILLDFQPLISKACRNVPPPQRHDLSQHIAEKIIGAVKNYDMDATPTYSSFICSLIPDLSKKSPPANKNATKNPAGRASALSTGQIEPLFPRASD